MAKKLTVPRPEDDRKFKLAIRERDAAVNDRDVARQEIKKRMAWFGTANDLVSMGGAKPAESEIAAQKSKLERARADEAAALEKIARLEPRIAEARREATKRLAAEVKPVVDAATRSALLAVVNRHVDEIAALATIKPVVDSAGVRRVPLRGMAAPRTLMAQEGYFGRLREDVERAMEVNAIKPADLPRPVREAWGL